MAISRLIQDKFFTSLPYPASSCAGKTIVVTGSNIGLGKEAARHYARLEASKLILAVRSVEKGNAAMADIRYTTGIAEDAIEVWSLDLASYESVLAFADRVSMELDRLDVFIGNAGMAPFGFTMAEQDEMTLTVNVVSSTLLALLVLPVLRSTAQRHDTKTNLCIVSSGAGSIAHFPEQDAPDGQIYLALSDEKNVDMKQRYSVSKLLQLLAMRSICEQLPPQYPVVINAVTPGFCIS
nr:short chain dehydrogenase sol3 [Quercus suber]